MHDSINLFTEIKHNLLLIQQIAPKFPAKLVPNIDDKFDSTGEKKKTQIYIFSPYNMFSGGGTKMYIILTGFHSNETEKFQ